MENNENIKKQKYGAYDSYIYNMFAKNDKFKSTYNFILDNYKYSVAETLIYMYTNQNKFTIKAFEIYLTVYENFIKNITQKTDLILKKINYRIQETGGAGHCFFYSIAYQVYFKEWSSQETNFASQNRVRTELAELITKFNQKIEPIKNEFISSLHVNANKEDEWTKLTGGLQILTDEQINNITPNPQFASVGSDNWGEDYHIPYISLLYGRSVLYLSSKITPDIGNACFLIEWGDSPGVIFDVDTFDLHFLRTHKFKRRLINFGNQRDVEDVGDKLKVGNALTLYGGGGHWQALVPSTEKSIPILKPIPNPIPNPILKPNPMQKAFTKQQLLSYINTSKPKASTKKNSNPLEFRIRDYEFNVINYDLFNDIKQYNPTSGHSMIEKAKLFDIEYYLKYMSIDDMKPYNNFELVLAVNEIMSAVLYNKIFKLYAPILHLVYRGDNFMVASKSETLEEHSYGAADFIKGMLVDVIMSNWDVSVKGNVFEINKDPGNNNTTLATDKRFLRLDVGGCMSMRAKGADKIKFIDNYIPDEIDFFSTQNKMKFTEINIRTSLKYIIQLYTDGQFTKLDETRNMILNKIINNKIYPLNPVQKGLIYKLVNGNIIQVKRRWLWCINQYGKISINHYQYDLPIQNNIIPNELPIKWDKGENYPLPHGFTSLNLNKINDKVLNVNKGENIIRIMSLNFNENDRKPVNTFIADKAIDIKCYQETQVNYTSAQDTANKSGHKLECNPKRTVNNGNKNGFALEGTDGKKYATNGKCVNELRLEFIISKVKLVIYNVHLDVASGPNGIEYRTDSLKLILEKYNAIKIEYPNAIILGDFNTYNRTEYTIIQRLKLITSKGDKYKYNDHTFMEMGFQSANEYTLLDTQVKKQNLPVGYNSYFSNEEYEKNIPINILKHAGFVEAFEITGLPSPINTSHFSGKVDFIFLSPDWNIQIAGLYTHYSTFSDHLPLFIDLKIP